MITFNYVTDFDLSDEEALRLWVGETINEENRDEGEINYIFCTDDYLYDLNVKYLNHTTLTDIITFDYTIGKELHADIYISVDRVRDNAGIFKVSFQKELQRVMIHGILHLCGYKDKSSVDQTIMRAKEDYYLQRYC